MASQPPGEPPESIVLGAFSGLKNTVASERLGQGDLERAINIDLDDAGHVRRRRGYNSISSVPWHSLRSIAGKVFGVRDGILGRLREDYSFTALVVDVGIAPVAYAAVAGDVFFCNPDVSGIILEDDIVAEWGRTDGQGKWLSPVMSPTDTLGAIAGKLLGDPVRATCLETYKGRIYMAAGRVLWATELFVYSYVDRTRGFMQFEHDITLLMAADDGLYVGTVGGLYFIQGTLGQFKLVHINDEAVLPGSGQSVPCELVHPGARGQPMQIGDSAVFMTSGGIIAGFDGGACYNLTSGTVIFPQGVRAAALFRQDQGANAYVAAIDSAGNPATNARIGDYVDAEIVRPL